jgi:hypothetical protein
MTHDEALARANELRGRHNSSPFNSQEKRSIEELHREVIGYDMKPTTCQNCYHDALILIILRLKKTTAMAKDRQYTLRNGFIIHSPIFHQGAVYTNANLTDEVAREYLERFPANVTMFSKIPQVAKSKKHQRKNKRK